MFQSTLGGFLLLIHLSQVGKLELLLFYADRLFLMPNYLSSVIKDNAFRLNFATQSAFGKYFKLQTGTGPKFYRNEHGRIEETHS